MFKEKEIIKREYLFFSIALFFFAFSLGVCFSVFYPALAQESLEELIKAFSFLLNFGPIEMGLFLFFNNSIKVFLFMFLGVLLAIPTIFFLFLNGWVLGYVVGVSFPELGIKGLFYSLFLHGVFELTALFIGSAIGILIGIVAYKEFRKEKKILPLSLEVKKILFKSFKIFLKVIMPLLFVAALIETLLIYF
jgi:stage II sporulation protein M